jgi:hypothetical protein
LTTAAGSGWTAAAFDFRIGCVGRMFSLNVDATLRLKSRI